MNMITRKTNAEEQVDHQRQRRAGEEVADVLQLAHARDRIADPARLEIGDRQRQKVAEQPRAEFHVDAVGRMREQIGAQDVDDGLEHRNGDEPDDQDIERAQRPIDQDLVDDDLEDLVLAILVRRHPRHCVVAAAFEESRKKNPCLSASVSSAIFAVASFAFERV